MVVEKASGKSIHKSPNVKWYLKIEIYKGSSTWMYPDAFCCMRTNTDEDFPHCKFIMVFPRGLLLLHTSLIRLWKPLMSRSRTKWIHWGAAISISSSYSSLNILDSSHYSWWMSFLWSRGFQENKILKRGIVCGWGNGYHRSAVYICF